MAWRGRSRQRCCPGTGKAGASPKAAPTEQDASRKELHLPGRAPWPRYSQRTSRQPRKGLGEEGLLHWMPGRQTQLGLETPELEEERARVLGSQSARYPGGHRPHRAPHFLR